MKPQVAELASNLQQPITSHFTGLDLAAQRRRVAEEAIDFAAQQVAEEFNMQPADDEKTSLSAIVDFTFSPNLRREHAASRTRSAPAPE